MARLVHHDQDGPYEIKPSDKSVFVCGCGLSQNMPLCDGSHKACKKEDEGKIYVYDKARKEVEDIRDA